MKTKVLSLLAIALTFTFNAKSATSSESVTEQPEIISLEEYEGPMMVTSIEIIEEEDFEPSNSGKINISSIEEKVLEVQGAPVGPKVTRATPDNDTVFTAVEEQAGFPGGQDALMKWLQQNVRYPELAQQNNVQGKVFVKFTVEKDGSLTNPEIVKSVDKELDQEAIRLVKKMPKWKPAKNNGKIVRSYYYLPVNFSLD